MFFFFASPSASSLSFLYRLAVILSFLTQAVSRRRPRELPTHLLGIGDQGSVMVGVKYGMDTFDSSYPTRVILPFRMIKNMTVVGKKGDMKER